MKRVSKNEMVKIDYSGPRFNTRQFEFLAFGGA